MENMSSQQQSNIENKTQGEAISPLEILNPRSWLARDMYSKIFFRIPNDGTFAEISPPSFQSVAFWEIQNKFGNKKTNHIIITKELPDGSKEGLEEVMTKIGEPIEILLYELPHRFFDGVYVFFSNYEGDPLSLLKVLKLKVKKDGIIAGDDIFRPEVWKAIREIFTEYGYDIKQKSFIHINR